MASTSMLLYCAIVQIYYITIVIDQITAGIRRTIIVHLQNFVYLYLLRLLRNNSINVLYLESRQRRQLLTLCYGPLMQSAVNKKKKIKRHMGLIVVY